MPRKLRSSESPPEPLVARPRREKKRLDVLLVERGLASTRQRAQALILAGEVCVNGAPATKAGTTFPLDARIESRGNAPPYVSRAGVKLEGALGDFGIPVEGRTCLDVGSSTGGFTDCLLQHSARRVYSIDVNTAQLDWKLRQDPRVVPIKANARYLKPADVGEAVDLVVVDVSFISATRVLPALIPLARPGADFLVLIKPQFELERREIGKGGIVRAPGLRRRAVERVVAAAAELGLEPLAARASQLTGAEGNLEFFLHARRKG